MFSPKAGRLLFVAGALAAFGPMAASAQMLINGAGATFPQQLYTKWFDEYRKVDPSVSFNYQGIGSGGGQAQILNETVDFGASDGPMSDEKLAKAPRTLWHIPTVAGAVAVCYNLEGSPQLKFDGPTLVGIYLGAITKWNDPAIASLNPEVKLPADDIVVVHRSDGSGTSFIFTDYLTSISPDWKGKVNKGVSVNWPTGLGGKGNAGVAGQVKQTPGAIGYVEMAYAHENQLPVAAMKNSSGAFVMPTVSAVTAALTAATIPEDFRFSMVNSPGPDAYPIAGATWFLIYAEQKDHAKGEKLVQFLKWAYADGEKLAPALDYAPLPAAIIKRALDKVESIKY
jgi:phosphate transport system substrate-binding protein